MMAALLLVIQIAFLIAQLYCAVRKEYELSMVFMVLCVGMTPLVLIASSAS